MFETERLQQIHSILSEKNAQSVQALANRLYVSPSTIRRDLNELERLGQIKRVHGGAVLITGTRQELPLYLRERQNADAKELIAYKAISHIRSGQVLFLDASSTVQRIVPHLDGFRDLTIITNGLKTAQELIGSSHNVYCTGGLMLHNSSAYVGHFAERALREFNADLCFFSSRGLSADGRITDASAEETQLRKVMLAQSRQRIFLCDSSKFNTLYCHNLCHVNQTDLMISDKPFALEAPTP